MKVFIYVLKHPETLEIRYVGLTRFPVKRLNNEINYPHTKHLRNWVKSLKNVGLKPLMEVVEESEEGAACDGAERKWIAEMKSRGCRLINFTDGGERGYKCSKEYLASLSAWQKGKKKKPHSAETKEKMSAAHKGTKKPWSSERFIALNKSRAGIPLSDEHRKKVSEGVKKGWTEEVRLKASISHKNRPRNPTSEETKAKQSIAGKKWHQEHREEFLDTMRKRGATAPIDPKTGRFTRK